jgi:hypothetical protein
MVICLLAETLNSDDCGKAWSNVSDFERQKNGIIVGSRGNVSLVYLGHRMQQIRSKIVPLDAR